MEQQRQSARIPAIQGRPVKQGATTEERTGFSVNGSKSSQPKVFVCCSAARLSANGRAEQIESIAEAVDLEGARPARAHVLPLGGRDLPQNPTGKLIVGQVISHDRSSHVF
jgi:hypothetical protein